MLKRLPAKLKEPFFRQGQEMLKNSFMMKSEECKIKAKNFIANFPHLNENSLTMPVRKVLEKEIGKVAILSKEAEVWIKLDLTPLEEEIKIVKNLAEN